MNASDHILVAEDSPVQATLLKRSLVQQGYAVTIAKHGQEALKNLQERPYGLIISDVEMPVMNGYELCRTVKQDHRLQSIPVILLTTLADPRDLMEGLSAGADSFLTKPYDEAVLLSRVNSLFGRSLPPQQDKVGSIHFAGDLYEVSATKQRIFNLLLSTYENAMQHNEALTNAQIELKRLNKELDVKRRESDALLLNILPQPVAEELKTSGQSAPEKFDDVTVMFTDFVGFTTVAEQLTPSELVQELGIFFNYFDECAARHSLEKMKTIGDSYMVAGGLPVSNATHPIDCILAALDMQRFVSERMTIRTAHGEPCWAMRVGIHTGSVVAGVIGKRKFAYDIWGDTVNLASRMESSGEQGSVNISEATYLRVRDFFSCTPRGKIQVKNKGQVEMFFVEGIRPAFCEPGEDKPNPGFWEKYHALTGRGTHTRPSGESTPATVPAL